MLKIIFLQRLDAFKMKDEREILSCKLQEIGLNIKHSTLIALEAGSSQTIVNEFYLLELGISNNLIQQALEIIRKFYFGELAYYNEDWFE